MKCLATLLLLFVMTGAAAAQTQPEAAAKPAEEPAPLGPRVNVKVEVTVSEDGGGAPPSRRTTSLTVVQGRNGSVRTEGKLSPDDKFAQARFHLDARPLLEGDNRIRLGVTLIYASPTSPRNVTVRAEPVMESGRRMVISETADVVSDRKITVEVMATILK